MSAEFNISYEQTVERYADEKNKLIFPNSGKEHASIVMANMFTHAQNTVRMLVGNFSGNVSNHKKYQQSLKQCLERGCNVSILLENPPNQHSEVFNILKEYANKPEFIDKIEVKQFNNQTKLAFDEEFNEYCHFAVFDTSMFRLETDPKNYRAVCCFNNKDISQILINKFDIIFKKGDTYSLSN